MKRLSNVDLGGVARITNAPAPQSDSDVVNRGYVLGQIQQALENFDYQSDVKGIQTDATLSPGTPVTGDRYIINNVAALNAGFGVIAGVENGDIVEYNGAAFYVAYDVSVKGDGVLVFNHGDEQWYKYVSGAWSYGGISSIVAGLGLQNSSGIFNVLFDGTTIGLDGNGKLTIKKALLCKAAADIGDGTNTEITYNHGLNTTDVFANVISKAAPQDVVSCDIEVVDANNVKLSFVTAPAANAYRVVVIG